MQGTLTRGINHASSLAHRSLAVGTLCLRRTAGVPKGREGRPGTARSGRTRRTARSCWADGISGTFIRFVDGECRQACTLSCQDNERILSTYAINPGGTFVFDADNKATFRPQRQGVSVKVVLACAPKG